MKSALSIENKISTPQVETNIQTLDGNPSPRDINSIRPEETDSWLLYNLVHNQDCAVCFSFFLNFLCLYYLLKPIIATVFVFSNLIL